MPDWMKAKLRYEQGILSNRQVARENGMSEAAIRKRVKAEQWKRLGTHPESPGSQGGAQPDSQGSAQPEGDSELQSWLRRREAVRDWREAAASPELEGEWWPKPEPAQASLAAGNQAQADTSP